MKIAIPLDNKDYNSNISPYFGRAKYFLIYDINSKQSKFIENSSVSAQGGAGIKAAQLIVDNDVKALLSPRCGEKAALVLQSANIEIYKTINSSIEENISLFKVNQLSILNEISTGLHRHQG